MFTQTKYNNQRIRIIALLILLVVISLIPSDTLFDARNTVCIHHRMFGFECPLCGMTRAVYQFIHLEFSSAFRYNAVIALLPLYLVLDITTLYFHQRWLQAARKGLVILILAAFLLLYCGRIYQHFYGI